jgi:hypothetical protein
MGVMPQHYSWRNSGGEKGVAFKDSNSGPVELPSDAFKFYHF